jgi:hypothetical protein
MKSFKFLVSLFLVLMVCTASTLEDNKKGMYIVGVSASFTDSLIYFTDVQFVDSVTLNSEKLLSNRSQYSEQLEEYLKMREGGKNRTCFIYYNKKKASLEKMVKKMKEKYQKDGKSILKETGSDFKFTKAIDY